MTRRLLAHLAAVTALACAAAPAGAAEDPVFGVWLTQAKDGRVRVGPCANDPAQACGVILWARGPNGEDGRTLTDRRNPDPALQKRPIIGLQIISGFHREGGGWAGGRIYDPDGGKTYKAKMVSGGPNTLKVAGCVLMFCRSETWTRVE